MKEFPTRDLFFRWTVLQSACSLLDMMIAFFAITAMYYGLTIFDSVRWPLVSQKILFILLLLALRGRLRSGQLTIAQSYRVVTAVLVLGLGSAAINVGAGLSGDFTVKIVILFVAAAMVDLGIPQFCFHVLLFWLAWAAVGGHDDSQATALVVLTVICAGTFVLRRGMYWRQFDLLRQASDQGRALASALAESEQSRRLLDQRVEERTVQLRLAYEELRLSTREREQMAHESEKLQEQLLHAQKMESLGRLAGGVAHDFNNLLTVIMGSLDLVRSGVDTDSSDELLNEAQLAARRAADVTGQLLAFSRKQVMNVKPVHIQKVVEQSMKMVERLVGEDIRLHLELDCDDGVVVADASQLQQVLINLVVNARDAMPSGGDLHISLRAESAQVILEVRDTGSGIPPELQNRIFEPFFTTKQFGEGTGLGLSTVLGVVSQHGGRVEVVSEPSERLGTTFLVTLPLAGGSPEESSPDHFVPPTGMGTILLVEDDDQVRNLAVRVLQLSGYKVIALGDAEKALEFMRQDSTAPDLLITDVVMPGMDGGKLAGAIAKEHPSLPVLFISGYTDDRLSQFGIQRGQCEFLQKPFGPSQLCLRVGQILRGTCNKKALAC